MRLDLARQITRSGEDASVIVGDTVWNLHVFGITRVGREVFIQIALIGPRTCTVTVRSGCAVVHGVTGRRILDAVCDWLLSGDPRDHAYLEAPAGHN
jgi:hypothetical protein